MQDSDIHGRPGHYIPTTLPSKRSAGGVDGGPMEGSIKTLSGQHKWFKPSHSELEMGAASSSPGTRATVYRDGDKAFSVVRISDEVIRRLREGSVVHNETAPEAYDLFLNALLEAITTCKYAISFAYRNGNRVNNFADGQTNVLTTSQQLKQDQDVHHRLDDLIDGTEKKIKEAADSLHKSVFARTSSAVCVTPQEELLKCYSQNPKRSLRCRETVEKFLECVAQHTITDRNLF
ncbi:CHCH domain protein [Trichuris suis]|nr:CHCH domain protein [Trichuris suis]